jgi:hypothetical protein
MENLSFPIERLLFNTSLGVADVGLYADSKKGKNILSFKKHGLNLQGIAGTTVPKPDSVRQKYTCTITGDTATSSFNIEMNGYVGYVVRNTNLATTLGDFVTNCAAGFLAVGVVVTAGATTLIFESSTAGVPISYPVFSIVIAGATAYTCAVVQTTANYTAPTAQAATIKSVKKTSTKAGTVSGGLIFLNNVAPCITCDYEYHLNFRKEVQFPGQDNFETNEYSRHYGGTLARPVISAAGIFDDATMLAIEKDLIDQIQADKGVLTTLTDIHDQAHIEARRFFIIKDTDPSDASVFTAVWEDGTASTVVTSAVLNSSHWDYGNLGQYTNATSTLKAYRIAENTYMVTSVDSGKLFTVTVGTETEILSHGIYYKAIDALVQATPMMEPSFGYYKLFSSVTMTTTLNSGANTITGVYNQTPFSHSSTNVTSAAVSAAAINTVNTSFAIPYAALPNSTTSIIISALGIRTFNVKNSVPTLTWTCQGVGTWGYLTGDDVFRIFANRTNSMRPQWQRIDQPAAGTSWFKYIITLTYADQPASVGGAGDRVTKEQTVEIYVNQARLPGSTALYTAADA